jgi:hypothetical protein
MTFKHLLAASAVAAFMIAGTAAKADTVIGQESDADGFVGNLLPDFPGAGYLVASDGEASFHPFGATFDVSDGIDLSGTNNPWTQAADSFWTAIGAQTWVLPANLTAFGCGVENEPSCEPVGHFIDPGFYWTIQVPHTWVILDSAGAVSDKIVTYNDANGVANIKFYSDPSLGVPEPATWAMMLVGFFGLGAMVRARRAVTA